MAEGIRAPNLPLGVTLGEFIGHEIVGTTRSVRRFSRASVLGNIEAIVSGFQAGGGVVFNTWTQAGTKLDYAANQMAWIVLDPTPALNGVYQKQGASGAGSWTRVANLPYSFYRAQNDGTGSANAIVATNAYPAASTDALVVVNISHTNTSSTVTLALNGASPLTVKTASGNGPAVGGFVPGMVIAGYIYDTEFRMISDQASSAIQAASEAAAATAEAARDIATGAMSVFEATVFATKALALAYAPAMAPDYIRLEGHTAVGDNGRALYKKVALEPTSTAKFSITLSDGVTVAWYQKTVGVRVDTHANIDAWPVASGDTVHVVDEGPQFGRAGVYQAIPYALLSAKEQARADADTLGGVYIKSAKDTTQVWRRQITSDYVMADWFGAEKYTFGGAQDSTAAFQAALDFGGVGSGVRFAGVHRLTDSLYKYDGQSLGGFVTVKDVDYLICANPEAFTGMNTATQKNIGSALFFDISGGKSAIVNKSPGTLHDCLIYGKGYTTVDGSLNIRAPNGDDTKWVDARGITFGKYYTFRNVNFFGFKYALDSRNVDGYQGNYYTKLFNVDITSCNTAFYVASTDSYNLECNGCRLTIARFGVFEFGIRNWKFIGGSVEQFSVPTTLRGHSQIYFDNTYFETKVQNSTLKDRWLFECVADSVVTFSVNNILCYLNNYKGLIYAANSGSKHMWYEHGGCVYAATAADTCNGDHFIFEPNGCPVSGRIAQAGLEKDPSNTRNVSHSGSPTAGYEYYGALIS